MLLRFQVANHRSILEPVELSMIAVDEDRAAARRFDRLSESVLTVAGIYGPNASGKSNVLEAIAWLSHAVAVSLWRWQDHIPREPHRFGTGPASPTEFDVDFIADGVRFGYRLEVDDSAVLYESLLSYPERRRRTLFERKGEQIQFRRGLSRASGIQDLLTPTTLALSAAVRLGEPEIESAGRKIAGIGALGLERRWPRRSYVTEHDWSIGLFVADRGDSGTPAPDATATRAAALELLRFADPEIAEVEIIESDEHKLLGSGFQVLFVRRIEDGPVKFELDDESAGTERWFNLLGPALGALQRGRILLFDEIDESLHPRLSARLIDLFRDPRHNPHGAQLIFTSHDTSILSVLNRDEVWFTQKDVDNATRLTALAEFGGDEVRRSLNLERAYLQGRFGAIPEIDEIDGRSALGLLLQAS